LTYVITQSRKDGGLWLDLKPPHIADQLRFARENGVTNFSCTFHPTDKIEVFPSFEGIAVTGLFIGGLAGIKNTASLNSLVNLRLLHLAVEGPVSLLDLSKLTGIEELEITWNGKVSGFSSLVNLKALRLFKYKPSSKELEAFKGFHKIRNVRLSQPTLSSLDGIQDLDRLSELQVFRPKGLVAFFTNASPQNLTGLKHLELSACKELDFNSLPVIEGLSELRIVDCGNNISNLEFVCKNFPGLKSLTFVGSESKDGNLDCLVTHPALERVTIDHKKHYSRKEKEINTLLAEKRNH
jgi:protein phosphatase 1 regulatory subunit 7